jgi:2-isopropylmalate synthase/UPF0716 protein FxsA
LNYFLVYLFLEVVVSVNISSQIGGLATFVEIIFSAMVGFMLLGNFRNTFVESMRAMQSRTISMQEFQKLNAFTLLGALLLIIPGFFSDIIGLFLQFSFFATLFARRVLHVKDNIDIEDIQHTRKEDDEIIDVEVIDDRTKC